VKTDRFAEQSRVGNFGSPLPSTAAQAPKFPWGDEHKLSRLEVLVIAGCQLPSIDVCNRGNHSVRHRHSSATSAGPCHFDAISDGSVFGQCEDATGKALTPLQQPCLCSSLRVSHSRMAMSGSRRNVSQTIFVSRKIRNLDLCGPRDGL
jgi:hypothetical protein